MQDWKRNKASFGAISLGPVLWLAVFFLAPLAIVWTYQRRQRPLHEIAAGWGAWAVLAPRIAFGWYAVWCLPFFLLSLQESKSKTRVAIIVITLALLNFQTGILIISFATLLLFGALVWTSFKGSVS